MFIYTTEHGEADKAGRPGSETALSLLFSLGLMVVADGVSVASAIDSTQRPPVLNWSATTTRRVTVDKASVGADGFRDDSEPTERVGAAADEAPPATLDDGSAACFRRP